MVKTISKKTLWHLRNNTRYESCTFDIDFVEHIKGCTFVNCRFPSEGVCFEFVENCRFMNCSFVEFIVEQMEKSLIKGGHMQCLRLSNLLTENRTFDFLQTKNIKELHFDNCEIEKIPISILGIQNLLKLYLSENNIAKFSHIEKLSNLNELYLDKNNIKVIPREISQLHKLQILALDDNRIEVLPEEVTKLTNLRKLYLANNCIADDHKSEISKMLPDCQIIF